MDDKKTEVKAPEIKEEIKAEVETKEKELKAEAESKEKEIKAEAETKEKELKAEAETKEKELKAEAGTKEKEAVKPATAKPVENKAEAEQAKAKPAEPKQAQKKAPENKPAPKNAPPKEEVKKEPSAFAKTWAKIQEVVPLKNVKNGVIDENPIFVQVLGMCPTLAVTTSAKNGLGMGLATTVVLMLSNLVISLLRNIIPDKVRIPAFIVVIASFVTVVDLLLQGFVPSLYASLGLFIPLIVVNCVILGRAEAYASKNRPIASLLDGLGMGLGFAFALTILGSVREILGAGSVFGVKFMEGIFSALPFFEKLFGPYQPISIMILAPGAFIALGIILAIFNKIRSKEA